MFLLQHRILAFFSTKSSSSSSSAAADQSSEAPLPARKSVWKSSQKAKEEEEAEEDDANETAAQKHRKRLYRALHQLDQDLSKVVKEETVLYELTSRGTYRLFFVFVVFQYVFWAVCANVLFMFYSGVDSQGNKLRDLYQAKKEDEGKGASFTRTWMENISSSGWQFLVQGFFFLIGNVFAAVIMFLMTRCISSIRLLPGGRQVAINRLTAFGGVPKDPKKKAEIFSLSDLSALESRVQRVNYISIRVRGRTFSYMIDKGGGRFRNEALYDQTVGVQRNLNATTSSS